MFQKKMYKIDPKLLKGVPSMTGLGFSPVAPPKDGEILWPAGSMGCRERLIPIIRSNIMGDGKEVKIKDFSTDKLHLLFLYRTALRVNAAGEVWPEFDSTAQLLREWVERSVQLVHAAERYAGWPKTKVYPVEVEGVDNIFPYYFLGSRRWLKAPYLVSLYVLLVRCCRNEFLTGYKDLPDAVKLILDKFSKGQSVPTDNSWLRHTAKYWPVVLKGYPQMFRSKKITYYWSPARLENASYGYSEGIYKLCYGNTQWKEKHQELMTIARKMGVQ